MSTKQTHLTNGKLVKITRQFKINQCYKVHTDGSETLDKEWYLADEHEATAKVISNVASFLTYEMVLPFTTACNTRQTLASS